MAAISSLTRRAARVRLSSLSNVTIRVFNDHALTIDRDALADDHLAVDLTLRLTGAPPIKPTTTRCPSVWQHNARSGGRLAS
jgi:hypothetical protein